MLVTKFRVSLQEPGTRPDFTGVELLGLPRCGDERCVDVTVAGSGYELRRLIAKRWNVFAAFLQLKPEVRENQAGPKS